MSPDTLSVVLRSADFIAMLQAAGMTLFIAMFGGILESSTRALHKVIVISAGTAIVLSLGQYALEAARMAGEMSGMFEPALQSFALHTASGVVLMFRLLGLGVIVFTIGRGESGRAFCVLAAAVVAASFVLTGHTAASPRRWVLAPLLLVHVIIVAFWFGSLIPLHLAVTRERPAIAARVVHAFSRIALWLVPGIFVAGTLMGLALVPHIAGLSAPYGESLLAKGAGFAILMGIAAMNKWRLSPAIGAGHPGVLRAMRRSLMIEYALIAAILSLTAAMTMFYSPE